MEDYFNQPPDDLRRDERPGPFFTGFTGGGTWVTDQSCVEQGTKANYKSILSTSTSSSMSKEAPSETSTDIMSKKAPSETPFDISARSPGPNYRFLWNMSKLLALNRPNVVPSAAFLSERWWIMNQWGQSMENAYVLNS